MKVHRVRLSSWTASFRYPNLISGHQPTLEVPPISTVLGLINAAAGRYLEYKNLFLGYYFDFEAKTTDLETIYQIELKEDRQGKYPSNISKSNVIRREFLYNCRLYIYLKDKELVDFLRKPYYSLVLGRSGDLVSVDEVLFDIELLENNHSSNVKGQIIPLEGNFMPGEIQALPKYFTNTIPRKNLGTEAFSIVSCNSINLGLENRTLYTDTIDGQEIDIYMHKLNF